MVSAVSFRWFCWFRWFRPFRFGGFARFGGFGCFVSVVSVVSVVSAVSFRWFRFVVSGFSTCLASEPDNKQTFRPVQPREFVPFPYEDLTLANLKKACADHYSLPASLCDVLVTNKGPSCTSIEQIPHRKDKVSSCTMHNLSYVRSFHLISIEPEIMPSSISICLLREEGMIHLYLRLCTVQIEASTSPPGIPRAFDCASCLGRGGI